MDTNLNILYKRKTIDTISKAQIKIDTVLSGELLTATFKAPPLVVNKFSCLSGNYFFVNSGLSSSNEDESKFNQSSVIDMYSSENGDYRYSFYLPNYSGKKLSDFKIHNKRIVAINSHYLLIYYLNL